MKLKTISDKNLSVNIIENEIKSRKSFIFEQSPLKIENIEDYQGKSYKTITNTAKSLLRQRTIKKSESIMGNLARPSRANKATK